MENLLLAYKKGSKNRRSRQEIANFEFELEKNLFQIRDKLADGSYHHNSPSLGGDAETSEVSRRGTHNLFSKAGAIHSARRSQFNQQSVLISLRMASSPCVLSKNHPVSAGTPRQARLPVTASTIYSAKRSSFASHGVLAMRFIKKRGFPAWQANFVKQGF
jgi:hypothetical protein